MLKPPSLQNNTTNVVIQQNSRKLLMIDILMSETCWALKKLNSKWHQVGLLFFNYYKILFVYVHILIQYLFLLNGSKPIFNIQMNRMLKYSASVNLSLQRTKFCINYEKCLPYHGAYTVQVGLQMNSTSNITHTRTHTRARAHTQTNYYVCFSACLTLRDLCFLFIV